MNVLKVYCDHNFASPLRLARVFAPAPELETRTCGTKRAVEMIVKSRNGLRQLQWGSVNARIELIILDVTNRAVCVSVSGGKTTGNECA